MYVLYVTTLLTTQFYDKFGALASKIIKKPEILLRYFLLICCCVKLHIHASWFFLSWYRTPHSFDYCVSCLLPYRHDGRKKEFLWCLKLKVITNEVAAAWLHKPVMDFSPWASTFKAEDKNLVRPRVMYWYSRTTNQEIAFLHDQQI